MTTTNPDQLASSIDVEAQTEARNVSLIIGAGALAVMTELIGTPGAIASDAMGFAAAVVGMAGFVAAGSEVGRRLSISNQ